MFQSDRQVTVGLRATAAKHLNFWGAAEPRREVQIRRERIDVAFVDYLLEDGTADRLTRALTHRKIPFALCTGVNGGQLAVKFAGTPIVAKPYTQADIQGVVDTLVANRLAVA